MTLSAPGHFLVQPRLFIDTQHGLCNRLRALSSAVPVARATGRRLVVVWRPDHHCQARLSDLLAYTGPVIEDDAADLMRQRAARVYNYMEIEEGACYREPILDGAQPIDGDIYVRAADMLAGPFSNDPAAYRFLARQQPSDAVLDLVRSVPRPSDVAVHIRMGTGPDFDHLSYESPANWPAARHRELADWRRKSDVSRFVARLDALIAEGSASTIFAAADLQAAYAVLEERYGPRLRVLRRDLFDRSAAQLQYALADLMLLTTAPRFLASTWSSFSDVAQWLARPGRLHERSGIDF
ncbi:MAG: hypothetical protein KDK01_11190 [Rhodobacteraceae bacterium]|nr:hypothetical protein [Paracoccaceae bacterium]